MSQCQGHKSCYSTHMFMSRNVTASIKKKFGGLEHGDECPKRISRSQVSDLVLKKRVCLFSVNPKEPKPPPPKKKNDYLRKASETEQRTDLGQPTCTLKQVILDICDECQDDYL